MTAEKPPLIFWTRSQPSIAVSWTSLQIHSSIVIRWSVHGMTVIMLSGILQHRQEYKKHWLTSTYCTVMYFRTMFETVSSQSSKSYVDALSELSKWCQTFSDAVLGCTESGRFHRHRPISKKRNG